MSLSRRLFCVGLAGAGLSACDKPDRPPTPAWRPDIGWDSGTRGFVDRGAPLEMVRNWDFAQSLHGFTADGAELRRLPGEGVEMTSASGDPKLRSPAGLGLAGARGSLVLVRLVRRQAAGAWDGVLYYATAKRGESASFMSQPQAKTPPEPGAEVILVYDMAHPTLGGRDWLRSRIEQIRLDTEAAPGGVVLVRQIAVAARPPEAPAP